MVAKNNLCVVFYAQFEYSIYTYLQLLIACRGSFDDASAVLLEIARKERDGAPGYHPELLSNRGDHSLIVRDEDDSAFERLKRGYQGLDAVEVEVVGGFVENEDVGLLVGHSGKYHT